jgi:hypothetical protein
VQYRIEKTVRGERTLTSVERLDDAGRVEEIARMMGGASVSGQVRASARELLEQGPRSASRGGAKGKYNAKGESESRRRGEEISH